MSGATLMAAIFVLYTVYQKCLSEAPRGSASPFVLIVRSVIAGVTRFGLHGLFCRLRLGIKEGNAYE